MVTLSKKVQAGTIGLPVGIKDITRADFRNEKWIQAIEAKGYRISWTRSAPCPCKPVNEQTDQPDPNCPLCKGSGWVFFKPDGAVANQKIIGPLTDIQAKLIADNGAVIHGIMTSLAGNKTQYDSIGPWLAGTAMLTVRCENKLGYYDRITCLDSRIVYAQMLTAGAPTALVKPKYPILQTNLLRSIAKTFVEGIDFTVVVGDIQWIAGKAPAEGTILSCHYLTHPTWRIVEHPHTVRTTLTKFKEKQPLTPQGTPQDLPVQAVIKYEFLL